MGKEPMLAPGLTNFCDVGIVSSWEVTDARKMPTNWWLQIARKERKLLAWRPPTFQKAARRVLKIKSKRY
jgi:hypothetical protein